MNPYYKEFKSLSDEDLNEFLNVIYLDSCEKGDLDKLKYILTSPELPKHADLSNYYNSALNLACENGHL